MGDYRTTTGEPAPASAPRRNRQRIRRISISLALAGFMIVAGTVIRVERSFLANGYVTTEQYAEVRPATVGTVAEILVLTGSVVTQGQELVRLDMKEEQAVVEEAQSRVLQTESELARREAEPPAVPPAGSPACPWHSTPSSTTNHSGFPRYHRDRSSRSQLYQASRETARRPRP
ncbi:MAG: efflux RND transporter periplasmic adaptor subunit, partial [bacterium]